jgi:hypothetical protein
MNKLGQSTNLVLLVGVILATAISVFAVYSTFDDVVRSMVTGDPEIAARELTSYMDIAASSPNELTIYAPTPITIAGFPAYGTVLLNAEDQEIRVHPYPQHLMQAQILKAMYGEISVEEVYSFSVLFSFRNSELMMRAQSSLAKSIAKTTTAKAKDTAVKELQDKITEDFFGEGLDRLGGEFVAERTYELASKSGKRKLDLAKKLSGKLSNKVSTQIRVSRGGSKLSKLRKVASWVWPPSLTRSVINVIDTKVMKSKIPEFGSKVVTRLEQRAAKKAVKRINKAITRGAITTVALDLGENAEDLLRLSPDPFSKAALITSTLVRRGIFMIFVGIEFVWTFWPIHHAILNSRDATEQIDNKFGTFKFHTGDIPIQIAIPNCESEPYVEDMALPESGFLEKIGLWDIMGALMNMPMSQSTDTIKTYPGITNQQDECFDAHNWYLEDGGIITEILTLEDYVITHPYFLGIAVPLAACGAIGVLKEPSDGSSCIMMMEATLLGAWSNQDAAIYTIEGWKKNWEGNTFMGGILFILLKPEPNFFESKLGAVAVGLYNLMPLNSQNLFSYISGADELIDGDKEYYMEDPLVIKISKEYDEEAEEYILVVDKAI